MTSNLGKRLIVGAAMVMAVLITGSATAMATDAGPDMGRWVKLDTQYKGWYSAGMWNDPAACGPFESSEDAVVWHLYADLPEGAEEATVKRVANKFKGKVDSEVHVEKNGNRLDVWAQVEVGDMSDPDQVRRGAHTSIRRMNIKLNKKVIPRDGSVTLKLGNVCYSGIGPVGEINIHLQAITCDSFDRIRGNEITPESEQWDATSGGYENWRKIYEGNAPKVRFRKKARRGCEFDPNQQFAIGTSAQMDNYFVLPGTTNGADGALHISSRDLPEVHQKALFWVHDQLWFSWVENQQFGAIQCYKDSLHADTVEWIDFHNYNRLPSDIYCVAWNVAVADAEPEIAAIAVAPEA